MDSSKMDAWMLAKSLARGGHVISMGGVIGPVEMERIKKNRENKKKSR